MKKLTLLVVTILGLALMSCSSVKVTTDTDKNTDFSKYKTYSFLGWQAGSDHILTKFDKERIYDAFNKEFTKRNMKFVEKKGDMAVSLYIVVNQESSVSGYSNYYGGGGYGHYNYYGGGGYGWGGGYASNSYKQVDYMKGTLVMDVFDEKSGEQIWQGVATKTVEDNPKKRGKSIPSSIKALMFKFPVRDANK